MPRQTCDVYLKCMKNMLHWTPRILAVLYILFFSIFALDALDSLLGFAMHMIPSFILIALTIIAWKRRRFGGLLFSLAGIFILVFYHSVGVALPAFVISFLFLSASWIKNT